MPELQRIPEDVTVEPGNEDYSAYGGVAPVQKHLNGYQGQVAARQQPGGYISANTDIVDLIKQDFKIPVGYVHYGIYVYRLGISTAQNGCMIHVDFGDGSYNDILIGDERVPNPSHLYEIHSPDEDAIRIKSIKLAKDSDSDMLIEYIAAVDTNRNDNW